MDIQTLRVSVFGEGQGLGFATGARFRQNNFGGSQLGFWSRQMWCPMCFFFFFEFHLFLASKETVCLICELWRGFQKRAFVIYDGIHYDVLVRRGPSGRAFFRADVEVMSVWLSLRRAETL